MYQRINITLPEETVQLIDRMVPKGDRSHFINEALKYNNLQHNLAPRPSTLT